MCTQPKQFWKSSKFVDRSLWLMRPVYACPLKICNSSARLDLSKAESPTYDRRKNRCERSIQTSDFGFVFSAFSCNDKNLCENLNKVTSKWGSTCLAIYTRSGYYILQVQCDGLMDSVFHMFLDHCWVEAYVTLYINSALKKELIRNCYYCSKK